jgi:hypothetical protein
MVSAWRHEQTIVFCNILTIKRLHIFGAKSPVWEKGKDSHWLPRSRRHTPYSGKQNRAKQSGGDREARGIFEFGTTVGFRSFPTSICTEPRLKSAGQSKNNITNKFALKFKSLTVAN